MVKNGTTTTYAYNNDNQLTTETAGGTTVNYVYDGCGNLIRKTAGDSNTYYGWDWRNLLYSIAGPGGDTLYTYDGAGNRISKTYSYTTTKYINDVALPLVQVLMETSDTGTVKAKYTYGNDLISGFMVLNPGYSVLNYYHYDGLGSTRQLTNNSQSVVASYTYDGFGNVIASSGSSTNPYGFTGERQFGEADGLVFLRARYYAPQIGRFMQMDPIGYIDGLNLYVYVGNNPIRHIDPYGLSHCSDWQKCPSDGFLLPTCLLCCTEIFTKRVPRGSHWSKWPAWYVWWEGCQAACEASDGEHGPDIPGPGGRPPKLRRPPIKIY